METGEARLTGVHRFRTDAVRKLAAFTDWVAEGRVGPFDASLVLITAYLGFQTIVTTLVILWAGTGLDIDDAEQLSYLPYLWAGYGGSQPPLFTWLNWIGVSIFGTNVFTLRLVKNLVLFLGPVAIHRAVRSMGFSRRSATTAAFGVLLIPQISWNFQHTLSHSVAAVGFSALALLAFAVLERRRTIVAYAAFGLAAAAMVLAKYNDIVLLTALLAAALSLPKMRDVILAPRFGVSILVAALALAPTLYWNVAHSDDVLARAYKFGAEEAGWSLQTVAIGFWKLVLAVAGCLSLSFVVFLGAFRAAGIPPLFAIGGTQSHWVRLLWRSQRIGLAIAALLIVVAGATTVRDRWLLPIVLLYPVAVAVGMEGLRIGYVRLAQNVIIGVTVAFMILMTPGIWASQIYGGDGLGRSRQLDFHAIHRELTKDGPVSTVISNGHWIGNLRLLDKNLATLHTEVPNFSTLVKEPPVMVFLEDEKPSKALLALVRAAGYEPDGSARIAKIPEPYGPPPHWRSASIVKLRKLPQPGNGAGTTQTGQK
jgi:hypothetical protein